VTRAESRHVREQTLYPKPLGSGKQKTTRYCAYHLLHIAQNICLHRLNVGPDSTFLY